jgi:PTS system ascorbate-specific IIA component
MEQENQDIHLLKLLNQGTLRAKVTVKDWEEATDAVGRLLVQAGLIRDTYIDAMKEVLKDMGPYAVIAPGIVLLHARPDDGVLAPCFGLITLAPPVEFGHSENDPVDIVLAMGATDKKSHLSALQQLASMLADDGALEMIRSAPDDRTLYDGIHTWITTASSS